MQTDRGSAPLSRQPCPALTLPTRVLAQLPTRRHACDPTTLPPHSAPALAATPSHHARSWWWRPPHRRLPPEVQPACPTRAECAPHRFLACETSTPARCDLATTS